MPPEVVNPEQYKQTLIIDHNRIREYTLVGLPIYLKAKPVVKAEEKTAVLDQVLDKKLVVLSGPSRIGKTSLAIQVQREYEAKGGRSYLYSLQDIFDDFSAEPQILENFEAKTKTKALDLGDLANKLKAGGYLVVIDELSRVIDTRESLHRQAGVIQEFIEQMSEKQVPLLIITHEYQHLLDEINKSWPLLAKAPKLIPRGLLPREVVDISLYGNFVQIEKQPQRPEIYQGMDEKTGAEAIRLLGNWPVAISSLVYEFSRRNVEEERKTIEYKMDNASLYKELNKGLWYKLETSSQFSTFTDLLKKDLKTAGVFDNFVEALQIRKDFPYKPYRENVQPYSARLDAISPQTLRHLLNLGVVVIQGNSIHINGLLFSRLISQPEFLED